MNNTALNGCCFKLQISTKNSQDNHPTQQPKLFKPLKSCSPPKIMCQTKFTKWNKERVVVQSNSTLLPRTWVGLF